MYIICASINLNERMYCNIWVTSTVYITFLDTKPKPCVAFSTAPSEQAPVHPERTVIGTVTGALWYPFVCWNKNPAHHGRGPSVSESEHGPPPDSRISHSLSDFKASAKHVSSSELTCSFAISVVTSSHPLMAILVASAIANVNDFLVTVCLNHKQRWQLTMTRITVASQLVIGLRPMHKKSQIEI